jgi:hypothetical protein
VETFNLQSTQYVDVQCFELTTHNGQCSVQGYPAFPRPCNNNQPLDDYAQNGFFTDNKTSSVLLQDVYVHGFNSGGLYGPIGGPITMNRVFVGFNAFAGWNFDDQVHTPDAPGSQILAHHVTMIGNGCYEEYPVKHDFSAQACYDDVSNGFGDAWSGQNTALDTFVCDDCSMKYNTKDAFIGPHTQIKHLSITNSVSIGNMGAQWKWGAAPGGDVTFANNLTDMNCTRMSMPLPGATQSFALSSKLPGANLSDFCRAGGDGMAFMTRPGNISNFYGNTFVASNQTMFDLSCAYQDATGVYYETGCNPLVWTDNNFLGYVGPANSGQAPGLWYFDPNSTIILQSSYNNEFGVRNGDACGTNNNTCVDPLQVAEPPQPWTTEAALDVFDPSVVGNSFYLTPNSPLAAAGTPISGRTTDHYGAPLPTPPPIGALALAAVPPPPPPPPPPALITPTITWATPSSIVSGTALSGTQLNAKASVPGAFVYAPAAGALPAVGTDTLSVAFTPTDPTKYTSAKAAVQLVVTQPVPVTLKPFTMTFSVTKTCTPTTSGSTVTWTCK